MLANRWSVVPPVLQMVELMLSHVGNIIKIDVEEGGACVFVFTLVSICTYVRGHTLTLYRPEKKK